MHELEALGELARARRRPGRLAAAEPRERRALRRREPAARGGARARPRRARGGAARAREDAQGRLALEGPQSARVRPGPPARRGARAARRREAAPRSAARRLRRRSRRVPPAPSCCPWSRRYEEHKRARGRARLRRPARVRARSARARRRGARRAAAPLHALLRRRVPGHRSAPGRDPAAARRRRSASATGARAVRRPGKLFLVGDPKQSIYRFRRADVALYEQIKERLRRARRRARATCARASARVPAIQAAVNAAFAPEMQAARRPQPGRVRPARAACAPTCPAQPALVVAARRRSPYGDYGTIVDWKIEESLPDAVGAFVDWLIRESGWTVRGARRARAGRRAPRLPAVPALPALPRRRHAALRARARGAPHPARARRRPLVPRPRGGDRAAQRARRDRVARRRALGLRDAARPVLRAQRRRAARVARGAAARSTRSRRATTAPAEPELREVARCARRARATCTAAATAARSPTRSAQLLEATRAHAGVAIWPTGEQALANCLRVMDLARRFERSGATSFRAFVERLEEDAERGEAERRAGRRGGHRGRAHHDRAPRQGARVPGRGPLRPDRERDARAAEPLRRPRARALGRAARGLRAARAARGERESSSRAIATRRCGSPTSPRRARAICSWCRPSATSELEGSWLAALHPAIYPTPRSPRRGRARAGLPGVRRRRVARAARATRGPGKRASVHAGRLTPRAGRHSVVWWDPEALALDAQERVGLRQQRILEADESGARRARASACTRSGRASARRCSPRARARAARSCP